MLIKDRIRELRRVPAGDLRPNPKNWRKHPQAQQDAMRGVLAEVGIADALLARELPDGTLMLIDGHLRADTDPATVWPVLVLDVNESEADKLLATIDPLAEMAESDAAKLDALLREVNTSSEDVAKMLADLAADAGMYDVSEAAPPTLASGDREPFQQMTFTLADEQAAIVNQCLKKAIADGPFVDSPNENSNGNALARIAEYYLGIS